MLSTVKAETMSQPAALERFLHEDLEPAPPGSVFVGAGDCFSASLITGCLSQRGHLAVDPYELITSPAIARGRSVYFVSTSGRTASNIAAAAAVEAVARERVAVTADPAGGLARMTDSVIFIPYRNAPRVPGTLSFSLSLLALMKIVQGGFKCDFKGAYSKARRDAVKVGLAENGVSYFLGNGPAYPVCIYAALKVHEMLGGRAQGIMLEEFGHAPIFALRKEDTVNIFGAFDSLDLGQRLAPPLLKAGFSSSVIPPFGSDPHERVFHLVFLSQLAVLERAKSMGLSRPYFAAASDRLAISDKMIY
ncbi:MAG TPA: hypothetical protein VEC02_03320 [Nitrososphaerales archaeon]|nr:hypothetical protein [Nitrososphaerales archaeon]